MAAALTLPCVAISILDASVVDTVRFQLAIKRRVPS